MSSTTLTSRRPPAWLSLLPFLGAVAAVAVVGGLAAGSAGQTYRALDLPAFAPPSWLFGPVWTVLYVMIAVAAWWVWREVGWGRELTWWSVQLVLNLAWTPLFFAADRYALA
jgi:tryptophan-rich sensory protein